MGKPIKSQRRGRGGNYESPSHRHKSGGGIRHPRVREHTEGIIRDITHDPGRTAPLAIVELEDGTLHATVAPEGVAVGESVDILGGDIEPGNTLRLRSIPEGTPIFNIESQPGDGGQFARSAGTNALIVAQDPKKVIVRLPSGVFQDFHPACRATIGLPAGGGHTEKPIAKAGKQFHAARSRGKRFPNVRGVAMNPVDHPHGGGNKQHVGRGQPGRNAPPGAKVGAVAARSTGKR